MYPHCHNEDGVTFSIGNETLEILLGLSVHSDDLNLCVIIDCIDNPQIRLSKMAPRSAASIMFDVNPDIWTRCNGGDVNITKIRKSHDNCLEKFYLPPVTPTGWLSTLRPFSNYCIPHSVKVYS